MIKTRLIFLVAILGLTQACQSVFTPYGAGNISHVINPASYHCDNNQILNAGVVEPKVTDCHSPVRLKPQRVGPAADKPAMTHRWWGSVAFHGEMAIDNPNHAGYITPDPITARISERGARILGIPNGLRAGEKEYTYRIPEPYREVFDGIAVGHSAHSSLEAYVKDYSDGSATVEWHSESGPAMEATFVHGSPYVFFGVQQGELVIRTHDGDGAERGIFHHDDTSLGLWTEAAGNRNYYLLVGPDVTRFEDLHSARIRVDNLSKRLTVALLPQTDGQPEPAMIRTFAEYAKYPIDEVRIDYTVDPADQGVTVTHQYRFNGDSVTTLAGMLPLHWKNSAQATTGYQVRSARGLTRYAATDRFSYTLPFVGVLPFFPGHIGDYDEARLQELIREFVSRDPATWNPHTDTYWSGKMLGKVAELAAIARDHGMVAEADRLVDWLKAELQDWFHADTSGSLDTSKYFVYDSDWHTLLGFDESFWAHQQLNDHHFHYGYFVRAAAEICRVDAAWCSARQYGPMVELLIRDYAGGRDDPLFPYLRNFDPAYGFSWASGNANFLLGNNNESTSEAANAYGAIILYGLITGQQDLVERGIYLHASSTASYWEYWNNIDRYRQKDSDYDNFPPDYTKPTTSIIWGNGHVFTTWFSEAYAHILGIQGLPLSPLVLHIGQHADYLEAYVKLGLSESTNGKPSGLPDNQWPDVWWNIWAMTNGEAAAADFASRRFDYQPEDGETKAHTYHWIHTFKALGHLATGTGALMASSPAAVAFDRAGVRTYIAYNYWCSTTYVSFSDGMALAVPPGTYRVKTNKDAPDPAPESMPCAKGSP